MAAVTVGGLARASITTASIAVASIAMSSCAGPFNQVSPCVVNCSITLQGSPATSPQPATWSNRPSERVVVEPAPH